MQKVMSRKAGSAFGGKKLLVILGLLSLLAAGCAKVVLQQSIPSSPPASYEELPK